MIEQLLETVAISPYKLSSKLDTSSDPSNKNIRDHRKTSGTVCLRDMNDASSQEELLKICERKIFRKIFGAVQDNGVWKIRTSAELNLLFKGPDIVTSINHGRIRWAGDVQRMPEDIAV